MIGKEEEEGEDGGRSPSLSPSSFSFFFFFAYHFPPPPPLPLLTRRLDVLGLFARASASRGKWGLPKPSLTLTFFLARQKNIQRGRGVVGVGKRKKAIPHKPLYTHISRISLFFGVEQCRLPPSNGRKRGENFEAARRVDSGHNKNLAIIR